MTTPPPGWGTTGGTGGTGTPEAAESPAGGADAAWAAPSVIVTTRWPPMVMCTERGSLAPGLGFSMRITGSRRAGSAGGLGLCCPETFSMVSVTRQLNGGSVCTTLARMISSSASSRNFFQLMPTSQLA